MLLGEPLQVSKHMQRTYALADSIGEDGISRGHTRPDDQAFQERQAWNQTPDEKRGNKPGRRHYWEKQCRQAQLLAP